MLAGYFFASTRYLRLAINQPQPYLKGSHSGICCYPKNVLRLFSYLCSNGK